MHLSLWKFSTTDTVMHPGATMEITYTAKNIPENSKTEPKEPFLHPAGLHNISFQYYLGGWMPWYHTEGAAHVKESKPSNAYSRFSNLLLCLSSGSLKEANSGWYPWLPNTPNSTCTHLQTSSFCYVSPFPHPQAQPPSSSSWRQESSLPYSACCVQKLWNMKIRKVPHKIT